MTDSVPDSPRQHRIAFWVLLGLVFALGAFLRLYLITDQLPLDDEWHGLDYTIANSCGHVFTHYTRAGASSVPMNLYRCVLLHTAGWSEIALLLPSLAAGLLALVLLPLGAGRFLGPRAAIVFAVLLAISPLLVLYSRVCRAYSIVALLGFLAVLALARGATDGRRRWLAAYVILGGLAIFFHPIAAVSTLAPLGFLLAARLRHGLRGRPEFGGEIAPSAGRLVLGGLGAIALPLALLLPGLLDRMPSLPLAGADYGWHTLAGLTTIIAGTANPVLAVLFWALLGLGAAALLRQAPLLGGMLLSIPVLFVPAVLVLDPNLGDWPLVLARYLIVFLPAAFVLAAAGLDDLWQRLEAALPGSKARSRLLAALPMAVLLAALLWSGPLPRTYAAPNSFTGHSAYQESYRDLDWTLSYPSRLFKVPTTTSAERMPAFYRRLRAEKNAHPIIEYPMLIGNHFNLLYYYQHFHQHPVKIGYFTRVALLTEDSMGFAFSDATVDHVLSRTGDKGQLRFSNLIDLDDARAIRTSGARHLILHRNLRAELFPARFGGRTRDSAVVEHLAPKLRQHFGAPVHEDAQLIVFGIDPE